MDALLETPVRDPEGGSSAILKRYNCRVKYATDDMQASTALAVILANAKDGIVAIDIETAPHESERQRLATLAHKEAVTRGTLRALIKLRGDAASMGKAKADLKALIARKAYAQRAGLDPDRASIRLLQLYGGARTVLVADMMRVSIKVFEPLWDIPVVAHNAAFELSFLHRLGIEPTEMHCTMQAVRLLYGPNVASLGHAVATVLGIDVDKTCQTSDWSQPNLTLPQVEYAAADAVVLWHLANRVLPRLAEREPAYEIQMRAIPAVVRMEARGFRMDAQAHAELVSDLTEEKDKAEAAYHDACVVCGRDDLAVLGVPSTLAQKEALLMAIMSGDEVATWTRTVKTGKLATKKSELRRAAHYPPIAALSKIAVLDKQLSSFGITLAAHVSPVTGRIHAHYNVAGTSSGRASCSSPNLQQIPRDERFRALFVAAPGNVLVAADFSSVELRAAAEISGDDTMRAAFARGDDLHRLTAATVTGKKPEEVTAEERSSAKRVNFGATYGMGPEGLVKSAWDAFGIVLTRTEAETWLTGFAGTYPTFAKWRRTHADKCETERRIVVGRDAAEGIGRVFELAWLKQGRSAYTVACNLPIQGACADASMLALADLDEALYAEGIDGGPMAWLHDEIVLEVPVKDATRAAELLEKAMVEAFAETFPNAPLNGLVEVHSGTDWASLKT
jgi:DNA polymerase I